MAKYDAFLGYAFARESSASDLPCLERNIFVTVERYANLQPVNNRRSLWLLGVLLSTLSRAKVGTAFQTSTYFRARKLTLYPLLFSFNASISHTFARKLS